MKKIIVYCLVLFVGFIACKREDSIQKYLVESQGKEGFVSFDIPVSNLGKAKENMSEKMKNALKSIHKINFTSLPYKGHQVEYETQKIRLQEMLKQPRYKNLLNISVHGRKIMMYYTGEKESINEVILFGYSKDIGVGVARVLGDKMQPSTIINAVGDIKTNDELLKELFLN